MLADFTSVVARFCPLNRKLADLATTSRFEKRPIAVMMSSVMPSLKKSWPASPDKFSKGNTANDGRPAR